MTTENTKAVEVTQAEALAFCDSALRNIDMPPMTKDDLEDIRYALQNFASKRAHPTDEATVEAVALRCACGHLNQRQLPYQPYAPDDCDFCDCANPGLTGTFEALRSLPGTSAPSGDGEGQP